MRPVASERLALLSRSLHVDGEELLRLFLSSDVLDALERLIDQRVDTAIRASIGPGPWLTVHQAAERLGCSPGAIRRRVERGRLVAKRQGTRLYVSRESVDALD
jgi:excisionase family DNA binding protein